MLAGELSRDDIERQAEALAAYLNKSGNRGAAEWFFSKDIAPADRAAILVALADPEEAAA